MRARIFAFLLCAVGATAAEPRNTSAIAALKDGPGKAMVQANCIPCHSTAIVAANHLTREEWDATITTMREKNGMWPLPPNIRKMILDYLEVAQRPQDSGLSQGKATPWAAPLYRPNPLWK